MSKPFRRLIPTLPPCSKRLGSALVVACLLSACSALQPADVSQPAFYSFDDMKTSAPLTRPPKSGAPVLVISAPHAAAGFDSQQMVYIRQPHKLEYFRNSQWVNAPATMLSPLAAGALERSNAFSAVLQSPTSVSGQYRLDLEVIRLQQEFLTLPSQEHFTLRAHLLNNATHQVVAWREFDAIAPAPSDDPYGGVIAANQAVRNVLEQLAAFCSDAVANLPWTGPEGH